CISVDRALSRASVVQGAVANRIEWHGADRLFVDQLHILDECWIEIYRRRTRIEVIARRALGLVVRVILRFDDDVDLAAAARDRLGIDLKRIHYVHMLLEPKLWRP